MDRKLTSQKMEGEQYLYSRVLIFTQPFQPPVRARKEKNSNLAPSQRHMSCEIR